MTATGFDALAPVVQYHVANTLGWPGLRPLQEQAVRPLLDGADALLLAPTAGGKTEAAALPLLSRMSSEDWRGTSVLYVCPLRALLNNLQPRLHGYAQWFGRTAAVRHGDTTAGERRRLRTERPDILLTTPESLESMLVSALGDPAPLFEDLKAVVIDEIHAFAGDDRGWHLQGVLARIEAIAGHPIQRIGLSATVGNPEELAAWLTGGRRPPAQVIDPGGTTPDSDVELDHVRTVGNAAKVISALHQGEKRLAFGESRRVVESLAGALHANGTTVFVSHSSLSAAERRRSEAAFAEARDCVITATSTLELGIDVGDLDRVIQVGAPTTVASMLQRLGRTGRRPGSSRNMLFLETGDEELLRAAGLLLLWGEGYVEPVSPPRRPYHVLAQQVLGLTLERRALTHADVHEVLDGWAGTTPDELDRILEHMVAEGFLGEDGALLLAGPSADRRYGGLHHRDIMAVFTADPQMTVLHGRDEIGTLDPAAMRRKVEGPRRIMLAGRAWVVTHVDWRRNRVFVEPSEHGGPLTWLSGSRSLPRDLCQAMRRVLLGEAPTGVARTHRADDGLATLRASYARTVAPTAPRVLVEENTGKTRWWTYGGGLSNQTLLHVLGRVAPELLAPDSTWDNLSITVHPTAAGAAALEDARREILRRAQDEPDLLRPPVDERALEHVKFGDMVPVDMLRDELAGEAVEI